MLDQMLGQRSRLMQTKLDALSVQIIERLRIRAKNLERILDEELDVSNQLISFERLTHSRPDSPFALEGLLQSKRFELGKERRSQDVECWRDLMQIMRDFLNTWESLQLTRTREQILYAPQPLDYDGGKKIGKEE